MVEPVLEYGHSDGNCSIIGGYVYRGKQLPDWNGVYLYGDYCSGVIWGLARDVDGIWQSQLLFDLASTISSFGLDEDGEVYVVGFGGTIYQLIAR